MAKFNPSLPQTLNQSSLKFAQVIRAEISTTQHNFIHKGFHFHACADFRHGYVYSANFWGILPLTYTHNQDAHTDFDIKYSKKTWRHARMYLFEVQNQKNK